MQKYETFCKTTRFSKDFFEFVGKLSIDATRIFQFTDADMPNNQRFTRHKFLLLRERADKHDFLSAFSNVFAVSITASKSRINSGIGELVRRPSADTLI